MSDADWSFLASARRHGGASPSARKFDKKKHNDKNADHSRAPSWREASDQGRAALTAA